MEKDFDIKKLPFWARWPLLWRYSKLLCRIGLHVPVRLDNNNGGFEIICQECFISMTLNQWKKFFGRF